MAMRAFLLLLAVFPHAVRADDASPPDLGGGLLQLGFGFLVILALLLGTLWLLKRVAAPHGHQGGLLRVVGSAAIGPRERVVVVEIGERWLVVGVAPGQVTALHDLPRGEASPPPPQGGDFAARIRRALESRNAS